MPVFDSDFPDGEFEFDLSDFIKPSDCAYYVSKVFCLIKTEADVRKLVLSLNKESLKSEQFDTTFIINDVTLVDEDIEFVFECKMPSELTLKGLNVNGQLYDIKPKGRSLSCLVPQSQIDSFSVFYLSFSYESETVFKELSYKGRNNKAFIAGKYFFSFGRTCLQISSLEKANCKFILEKYNGFKFECRLVFSKDYRCALHSIENLHIQIGDVVIKPLSFISNTGIVLFEISSNNLKDIENSNYSIDILFNLGCIEFRNSLKAKNLPRNYKLNYAPFFKLEIEGKQIAFIRKTGFGTLILSKRDKEDIEYSLLFRILESKVCQYIFRYSAAVYSRLINKKISLFFEKEAKQSEEGVFELCSLANKNGNSKNYYIIDDPKKIVEQSKSFIVKKYSLKYYFLFYASKNLISSEAPTHFNILKSSNQLLKSFVAHKKFVFLQHGIIYLKSMKSSAFCYKKEAFPDYITVSSDKEKLAVKKMLGIEDERILQTGIPAYDLLKPRHLLEREQKNILIMFTWRPYDENCADIKDSHVAQDLSLVIKILKELTSECSITICAHPKVRDVFNDQIQGLSFYEGKISDVLASSNLVITDYSSIAYNSFYQGAGVVFYQPDLPLYESTVGELIPSDDEYIGYRAFDAKSLKQTLSKGFTAEGLIDINYFRTQEFENRYKQINEFCDGKNNERIYRQLVKQNILE